VRTVCKHSFSLSFRKAGPRGPQARRDGRRSAPVRCEISDAGICGAARRQCPLRWASELVVPHGQGAAGFRADHTCQGNGPFVGQAGHINPTGARLTRDPPWDVKSCACASMPAAAEVAVTAPAEEAAAEAAERKVPPPPPPDKGKEEAKHPDDCDVAGKMAKDAAAAGTSCHGSCVRCLKPAAPAADPCRRGAEKGSLLTALVLATSGQETHDAWATYTSVHRVPPVCCSILPACGRSLPK
jgi:hypothetical protein